MRTILWQIPILAYSNLTSLKFQQMSRKQLVDRLKCRDGIRNVPEIHVLPHPALIYGCKFAFRREDGLDFCPKKQSSIRKRVVQRLDAKTVTSQQQTPASLVIDGKREHAS